MRRRRNAIIAALLLSATRAHAQNPEPHVGTSTYLNHVVEGVELRQLEKNSEGAGEASDAFWSERLLSLIYEYGHMDAAGSRAEAGSQYFAPELHLRSRRDFSVDFSAGYARAKSYDFSGSSVDADSVVLRVAPAQELLGLAMEKAPSDTRLTAGMVIDYWHTDIENRAFARSDSGNADGLGLAPNLVLSQVVGTKGVLSGAAIYEYETSSFDSHAEGSQDDSAGVFSLLARGDFYFPTVSGGAEGLAVHGWFTAQWKHDLDTPRSGVTDDWAEFAVFFSTPIRPPWRVRAGYALETFRSDYTGHRAILQIEHTL